MTDANAAVAAVTLRTVRSAPGSATATGWAVPSSGAVPRGLGLSRSALSTHGFEGKVGQTLVVPGRVEVIVDPESVDWDPCALGSGDLESLSGAYIAYISRADRSTNDAEYISAQTDWSEYLEICDELPLKFN